MNEKLTLPAIIQLLSLATGDTRKQSEDFIKEFVGIISSELADGNQVKIKDLGVFKTTAVDARKSVNVSNGAVTEIPAHKKVVFVPSKEIAAMVNEPFEMFETVEINDDADLDNIAEPFESEVDSEIERNSAADSEAVNYNEAPVIEEAPEEVIAARENVVAAREDVAEEEEQVAEEEEQVAAEEGAVAAEEEISNEETCLIDADSVADNSAEEFATEDQVTQKEESYETVQPESEDKISDADDADQEQSVAPMDYQSEINSDNSPEVVRSREKCYKVKRRRAFVFGFVCGLAVCALLFGLTIIISGYGQIGFLRDGITRIKSAVPVETVAADTAKTEKVTDTAIAVKDAAAVDNNEGSENKEIRQSDEKTDKVDKADEKESVPTSPSDKPVYDTISKTRYLTTMAKDHYGNYNLWPYIYIENKSFLGHPDRIKPGTKVVIPSLSKYGVDPKNPEDIRKAKRKGVEIYSRYK